MPAKTREQRLKTQREYEARQKARRLLEPPPPTEPIYDPRRDGPPVWRDATAYMLGDPPIGRRAIDQRSTTR